MTDGIKCVKEIYRKFLTRMFLVSLVLKLHKLGTAAFDLLPDIEGSAENLALSVCTKWAVIGHFTVRTD